MVRSFMRSCARTAERNFVKNAGHALSAPLVERFTCETADGGEGTSIRLARIIITITFIDGHEQTKHKEIQLRQKVSACSCRRERTLMRNAGLNAAYFIPD